MAKIKGGVVNKMLKKLAAGALLLGSSALWALGGHIAWSVERIVLMGAVLAVLGFAISL